MSSNARRRLLRDFKRLQSDPPHGCTAAPQQNDITKWEAYIFGPEDTIWEGATLKLTMEFSEDYPNRPPKVLFVSRVYHPNVYVDGRICIDILDTKWTSIYDVSSILTSLQSLLTDPNPDSPANAEAANLFRSDREAYKKKVLDCVQQSWADFADKDEDDEGEEEA
eukprot:UN02951